MGSMKRLRTKNFWIVCPVSRKPPAGKGRKAGRRAFQQPAVTLIMPVFLPDCKSEKANVHEKQAGGLSNISKTTAKKVW